MTPGRSRLSLFRLMGWRSHITVPIPRKCVACVAPHTSNWDLLIGKLFAAYYPLRFSFLIKKAWFFFPMNLIIRSMGGIPVHRTRQTGTVSATAALFKSREDLIVAVTPEGTRQAVSDWRKGFYYIALEAGVPILLIGLDYRRRLVECTCALKPSGDYQKDIALIKEHFRQYTGKHPGKFMT